MAEERRDREQEGRRGVSIKVLLSSTQILQTAALTDSSFRELIGVITGTLLERMTERMTGWLCDTGI